jgi:hypothetical protein
MSEEKSIPNYSPYGSHDYVPLNLRPSEHNHRDSSDYDRDAESAVDRKKSAFEKIADPAVKDYLEAVYVIDRADKRFFCDVLNRESSLRAEIGRNFSALAERVRRLEEKLSEEISK